MALLMKAGGVPCLQARRTTIAARTSRVAPISRKAMVVKAVDGRDGLNPSPAVGGAFESNWLRADPLVLALGFAGWTVPASIPTGALGGNSLFGLFTKSIGQELSHFPVGPAITDNFWLYLIIYHAGLFTVLLFGQIGVQGRKQGYWSRN